MQTKDKLLIYLMLLNSTLFTSVRTYPAFIRLDIYHLLNITPVPAIVIIVNYVLLQATNPKNKPYF